MPLSNGEIRQVPNMPGYYVDTYGKVWSKWRLRKRACGGRGTESYISDRMKEMKTRDIGDGYLRVTLRKDGKYHYFMVHQLVMITFVGPCPDGKEVCHSDGNKRNNHINNLYYGTRQQNMDDSVRLDAVAFGERDSQAKLTEDEVQRILYYHYEEGYSIKRIAAMFPKVCETSIGLIVRGKNWRRVYEQMVPEERRYKEGECNHWTKNPDSESVRKKLSDAAAGENSHTAKFTKDQVRSILIQYLVKGVSKRRLSKDNNVSYNTIRSMVNGISWKEVYKEVMAEINQ